MQVRLLSHLSALWLRPIVSAATAERSSASTTVLSRSADPRPGRRAAASSLLIGRHRRFDPRTVERWLGQQITVA
jgi:hypothetical protein